MPYEFDWHTRFSESVPGPLGGFSGLRMLDAGVGALSGIVRGVLAIPQTLANPVGTAQGLGAAARSGFDYVKSHSVGQMASTAYTKASSMSATRLSMAAGEIGSAAIPGAAAVRTASGAARLGGAARVGGAARLSGARGGTYVLRNAEGGIVRTGRTNNLARRQSEHLRDPNLAEYKFDEVYRTDNYAEQRGLEKILHDRYNPALNKIRPISPTNKNLPAYMDAAQKYLLKRGGR